MAHYNRSITPEITLYIYDILEMQHPMNPPDEYIGTDDDFVHDKQEEIKVIAQNLAQLVLQIVQHIHGDQQYTVAKEIVNFCNREEIDRQRLESFKLLGLDPFAIIYLYNHFQDILEMFEQE